MVRVNVCEMLPMNAFTVTVPGVDPAVTVICALAGGIGERRGSRRAWRRR